MPENPVILINHFFVKCGTNIDLLDWYLTKSNYSVCCQAVR